MGPVLIARITEIVGIGFPMYPAGFGFDQLIRQTVLCAECDCFIASLETHFHLVSCVTLADPAHEGIVLNLSAGLELNDPVTSLSATGLHSIFSGLINTNGGHSVLPVAVTLRE